MEFGQNNSLMISNLVTKTSVNISTISNNEIHWCQKPLIHIQTTIWLAIVIDVFIIGVISLFGSVANALNIIVYFCIGIFSDSNTVTLTGLAISDFICTILTLWACIWIFIFQFFNYPIYIVYPVDMANVTLQIVPIFQQVTCFLTCYVALERFVAVVFPFKVKYIFTAKKTLFAVCVIFVMNIASRFEQYTLTFLSWDTYPNNKSVLRFDYSQFADTDEYNNAIDIMRSMNVSLRFITFGIVVICNATMIKTLTLSNRKFRKSTSLSKRVTPTFFNEDSATTNEKSKTNKTASSLKPNVSKTPEMVGKVKVIHDKTKIKVDKDKRLFVMMVAICTLFIVCYIPENLNIIIFYLIFKECDPMNRNTFNIISSLFLVINSSSNIFIYYSMSSRYRQHFLSMFTKDKTLEKNAK